jgi:hypothetical protein
MLFIAGTGPLGPNNFLLVQFNRYFDIKRGVVVIADVHSPQKTYTSVDDITQKQLISQLTVNENTVNLPWVRAKAQGPHRCFNVLGKCVSRDPSCSKSRDPRSASLTQMFTLKINRRGRVPPSKGSYQ